MRFPCHVLSLYSISDDLRLSGDVFKLIFAYKIKNRNFRNSAHYKFQNFQTPSGELVSILELFIPFLGPESRTAACGVRRLRLLLLTYFYVLLRKQAALMLEISLKDEWPHLKHWRELPWSGQKMTSETFKCKKKSHKNGLEIRDYSSFIIIW